MDEMELWAGKVRDAGRRIARLLQTDVEAFVQAEVRRRFIDSTTVADARDLEKVRLLKAGTMVLATRLAHGIGARLEPDATWFDGPAVDDGADVRALPAVDQAADEVEQALEAFLAEHGFPTDPPVEYRLPARFIDGDNLGTLTRALWKARRHHRALQAEQQEKARAQTADERARRWDDA